MKIALLVLMAFAACTLPACRNEETTYRDNLERVWRMDRVFTNGQDVTQAHQATFNDYQITFTRSGEYTEQYNAGGFLPVTRNGTWEFFNDLNNIRLIDQTATRFYSIVELEESSFILTEESGGNLNRYELKPL